MKKAFTLGELLIVLTIMGVLMVVLLHFLKNNEEKLYPKLYYSAYNSLKTATYNIQKDVEDFNVVANDNAQSQGRPQANEDELKKFPVKAREFLELLASSEKGYINTSSTNFSAFCPEQIFTTVKTELDMLPTTFVATNGMRYYLQNGADSDAYYIVWVDINGSRRPNRSIWIKKRPDIVPFMIMKNNGTVVPMGVPTVDEGYMQARIVYANPNMEKDFSVPMAYVFARMAAYLLQEWTLDAMSTTTLYLDSTLPKDYVYPLFPAGVSFCSASGYDNSTDFPPCSVEIDKR